MNSIQLRLKTAGLALGAICAAFALAVGFAACGSDDETSSTGSSTTSTEADVGAGGSGDEIVAKGEISEADVEVGVRFIGGEAGEAKGEPIKIGLVVPTQGALSGVYLPPSAESAAALINEKLGGVGGRPLQLVGCTFGGTAEQGQACGTKLANDPDIAAVLYIPGAAGTSEFHAALGDSKTVLCSLPSPNEGNIPNQFCTDPGPLGAGAMATYMKDRVKAETVAGITLDDPLLRGLAASDVELFAGLGIELKFGFIDPEASDVTAAVISSGAQTADAVLLRIPTTSPCIPVAKSLDQLGVDVPVVSAPQCMSPEVISALGSPPEWAFLTYGPTVQAPGDRAPEVQLFVDTLAAYKDQVGDGSGAFTELLFGNVMVLARVLNELGPDDISTESISKQLAAYPGPAFVGDPKLKFGQPPLPSIGTLRAQFVEYTSDGWQQAAGGEWFAAPPLGG